ncbi:MAG: 50S ribosomal protein L1 [Patescibacteria group bacterium]
MKPRALGVEEIEKEQKEKQKKKAAEKKLTPVKKKEKDTTDKEEKTPAVKTAESKEKTEKKPAQKKIAGKKYQKAKKAVDQTKRYTVEDAVALLKKIKYTSFDESVDLHLTVVKTGLKGEVELPHATGKTVRVAILDDKVLDDLANGKINFDILITHPSFMPRLAKYAKVLGPKGLMPNPKAGTVSPRPEEVAKKFLKGTLRWKTEGKFPLIHQMIGKISNEDAKLVANIKTFIGAVGKANIMNAYVTSTMTPSVKLDMEKI